MSGTYIGARYNKDAQNKLSEVADSLAKTLNSTPINKEDIHTTVIYSRLPEEPETGTFKVSYKAKVTGYEIFGPEKDCLVLLIKCPELEALNDTCMDAGATSNYPKYSPHITIGYNVDEKLVKSCKDVINKLIKSIGTLEVTQVYVDPLKQDWADDYKNSEVAKTEYESKAPCWKGYKMVGLKIGKGGKLVPNCVPEKSLKEKIESRLFSVK